MPLLFFPISGILHILPTYIILQLAESNETTPFAFLKHTDAMRCRQHWCQRTIQAIGQRTTGCPKEKGWPWATVAIVRLALYAEHKKETDNSASTTSSDTIPSANWGKRSKNSAAPPFKISRSTIATQVWTRRSNYLWARADPGSASHSSEPADLVPAWCNPYSTWRHYTHNCVERSAKRWRRSAKNIAKQPKADLGGKFKNINIFSTSRLGVSFCISVCRFAIHELRPLVAEW